ncbi:MAG TPA: hypothetical protein VGJ18_07915 [Gemmatimonadaceae bacterium]|jgi:hypothetical protein
MQREQSSSAIAVQQRFREVNLHDARLISISIEPLGAGDSATVRLGLRDPDSRDMNGKAGELSFVDCTWFSAHVDFWNKRRNGDAIALALVSFDANRAEAIYDQDAPRARFQPIGEFLFFKVALCSIGELEFLARDFVLTR